MIDVCDWLLSLFIVTKLLPIEKLKGEFCLAGADAWPRPRGNLSLFRLHQIFKNSKFQNPKKLENLKFWRFAEKDMTLPS